MPAFAIDSPRASTRLVGRGLSSLDPGQAVQWRKLLPPAALLVVGLACLPFDIGLAQWLRMNPCPDALDKWLRLSEVFAHGVGVVGILTTVAVLDPAARFCLLRLVLAAFGSGLLANAGKLVIARVRPHHFSLNGSVAETFVDWFPLLTSDSGAQGCPSAHMATAVGLAMGLSWLYPRGRWLFVVFAVSAGSQRIVSGDHFLSDVLWGAAVGMFCAAGFFPGGLLSPWFDRWERNRRDDARAEQVAP